MMMVLLCFSLLIPLIMIAAGWLLRKRPPAHISGTVGYRTARSMASTESWRFAQEGRLGHAAAVGGGAASFRRL